MTKKKKRIILIVLFIALVVLIILKFGYVPWHNRCDSPLFNKKCDIITYFKSNIAPTFKRTFKITKGYDSRKESCEYVNQRLNC